MKAPLLIPFVTEGDLAERLADGLGAEMGSIHIRRFPDGEAYVRLLSDVSGRRVILTGSLHRPDVVTLPMLYAAATCRELGATQVGLVAPYLAYMRQDKRFQSGEAVTSRHYAALLSRAVDWLVTVDPHLHRYAALSEIYTIPALALHATDAIAGWVRANVKNPLLIGPDAESRQWVAAVAQAAGAPFEVLTKVRHGDHDVEVSVPTAVLAGKTPVLVDDVISTGRTMMAAVTHLAAGGAAPICIGVHGLFESAALEGLKQAGAADVITCNTVAHATNGIDVSTLLVGAVNGLLRSAETQP